MPTIITQRPLVQSESKVDLPDGFYTGIVGGANARITSQDYYGKTIKLKFGIKTMNLSVLIVIKNGFANLFDNSIKY